MAERSNSEKVWPYPTRVNVASKLASEFTFRAGSNGFVLPLIELTMSGTAFPPDRDFQ